MTGHPADTLRNDHAGHDHESIAAYAAGDGSAVDRTRAEAQVRDCQDCARLFSDLRAIASATRNLPPPFAISRDFRISPADAARLHGGRWRRLLGGLGNRRPAARPFAAAFMTLGIVGLVIASVPFISMMGSAGAAPVGNPAASLAAGASTDTSKAVTEATTGDVAAGSPAAAGSPGTVPGSSLAAPLATGAAADHGGARQSQNPAYFISPPPTQASAIAPNPDVPTPAPPPSPLVPLSLAFIAVGIGFFALGRRSARGP